MADLLLLLIADDPLARAGLAALLSSQPGVDVAGQSDSGADDLAAALAAFRPDVVIWDLGWQPAAQLETLSHFADEHAPPIVALLSSPELVQESRAAGARALLSRNTTGPQLVAAAQAVVQELLVFDEAFARTPVTVAPGEPLVEPLSQRELDVLRALAEGLSNKQIARQLEISEHTVKFHVNAILGKLGVQSRTEAVVRATRAGLILL